MFNMLGSGNAQIENGQRLYLKGNNLKEYVRITVKDDIIAGAVTCGRNKIKRIYRKTKKSSEVNESCFTRRKTHK